MGPYLKGFKRHIIFWFLTNLKVLPLRLRSKKNSDYLHLPLTFVIASGRSGTLFLASLLKSDPLCHVYHEPVQFEEIAHLRALMRPDSTESYLNKFRRYDIQNRILRDNCQKYVEVNGYLRLHAADLKKTFPNCRIIHLVRDPRNVVRSHMNRSVLTDEHPIYHQKMKNPPPLTNDEWRHMTRFEKLSWLWQYENRKMRNQACKTVRFESILTDFNYFEQHFIQELQLNINRPVWQQFVSVQINPSKTYFFPSYPKWSDELKKSFNQICGPEMDELGYRSEHYNDE